MEKGLKILKKEVKEQTPEERDFLKAHGYLMIEVISALHTKAQIAEEDARDAEVGQNNED